MCIQDNVAEFAGTTDSTVVAAEEQQNQSLLSETDWPRMTHMHKQPQYFNPEQRGNHLAGTEMKILHKDTILNNCETNHKPTFDNVFPILHNMQTFACLLTANHRYPLLL